jgi:type IV fimbrial biogenesis protein FimT
MRIQSGFTLLESVVTLAILGTVLGYAVSSIGDVIHELRLTAVSNDVYQQLVLARSEAIKRNGRVVLCKSANGTACTVAGGWEQGWILFQDLNNSATREPEEPVLQRLQPLPRDFRLSANLPLVTYVSYTSFGGAKMASGAFQAGTFTVCRKSADTVEARKVVVNAGGRPRVQKVWLDQCG